MDVIRQLVDFILHIDIHLAELIARYGTGTLVLLFLIVFAETGLVVTPFLPGDSLLFAAGAFAARGALDIGLLVPILLAAAILGDTVNYWIGHKIGRRAFSGKIPFIKQEYLQRTESFYERHGGKTIILARFVPIIRTFAPFVAGIGTMSYARFIVYNVVGAVLWVVLFTVGGYFFGNLPMVQRNFKLVILAIIVVSVMPIVVEFVRARRATPA
ncbi:MAG: DedA family protein [Gemmatimonadales bacterium]